MTSAFQKPSGFTQSGKIWSASFEHAGSHQPSGGFNHGMTPVALDCCDQRRSHRELVIKVANLRQPISLPPARVLNCHLWL